MCWKADWEGGLSDLYVHSLRKSQVQVQTWSRATWLVPW